MPIFAKKNEKWAGIPDFEGSATPPLPKKKSSGRWFLVWEELFFCFLFFHS